MTRRARIEPGSGNIFADLGLSDAKAHLLKAQIVSEIYRLAAARKLTQAQAGARMGIIAVHKGTDVDQPRNLAKSVTVE